MPISRQRIVDFVTALIAEEAYDDDEGLWRFADGSQCGIGVSGACRVAREFGGAVVGYWSRENPTAIVGGSLCEGHDFAVIAERWIVDYWAFRVAWATRTPVLDLGSEQDRELALHLYGEPSAWEPVTV